MPGAHQDHQVVQNKQSFTISSASLSSSFSSSGASSMLLPAAPPSSSHSDITTSDQFASVSATTFESTSGAPTTCPPPRPPPPTSSMGQVISRPQLTATSPPSSTLPSLGYSASSASSRLKRAFVGRRKKSDVTPSSASSPKIGTAKEPQNLDDSINGTMSSAPARQLSAKQFTRQLTSHVFNKKQSASVPASPALSGTSLPPPLPPKQTSPHATSRLAPVNTNVDKRISVVTSSSPIAPALDCMRRSDDHHVEHVAKENERRDLEKFESKEIRRKSDSTLSYHTIRPGRRTPRPVSLAESLHSTHTVVPVNKRLSALITDAEYVMPEEDDGERHEDKSHSLGRSHSPGRRVSPASSLKVRDRRSQSLNLGPPLSMMASSSTATQASMSMDAIQSTSPRSISEDHERPVAAREISASTFSSPLSDSRPVGTLRANPDSAVDSRSSLTPPFTERTSLDPPQLSRRTPLVPRHGPTPPSFRQTAISMTSGFAPAAGLARRAVEKMGRVWSSKNSLPSPLSSTVSSEPSSFSNGRAGPLSRASSSHSESTQHHRKKSRHTPHTPSVSSTGSSLSDYEGPTLGKRLRAPVRVTTAGSGVAGGLVFGRDLRSCVWDTAIDSVRDRLRVRRLDENAADVPDSSQRSEPSATLEGRYIPALVVRCAQHILAWGVQEQGLFRVSGRSSHIARLRVETDRCADFDLVQSSPGDLDPHAVAAIFKAYLRELPEPILTNSLMPYFDAAMASERLTNAQETGTPKDIHPALRKPPSLSTFAVPSFASANPPSEPFRKALSSLISCLPQENRDLLLTVTEVINQTAKRSQETKMPLSNLLLVLCPSLSMNPSLLQALCESEGIWDGIQYSKEVQILDALMENGHQSRTEHSQERDENEGLNNANIFFCQSVTEKRAMLPRSSNDSKRFAGPLPNIPVENRVSPPVMVANTLKPTQPCSSQDAIGHVAKDSSETSSSFTSTDDSSSASHLSHVGRAVTPNSIHFRLTNPSTPPSLSSSTESLSVPSLSSGSPVRSEKHLPFMDDCSEPQTSTSPHSPIIPEQIVLTTPPLRLTQAMIQPQFQFPSSGEGVQKTSLTHRKSTPSMSIASSVSGDMRSNSLASRAKRMKKPSLHLLFAKRSGSPVSSRSSQSLAIGVNTPLSAHPEGASRLSSASESSPESMVTAPQSSRFSYPPVLNTAIDESSISLALGIEEDREDGAVSGAHTVKDALAVSPQAPVPHNHASQPSQMTKEGTFRHLDIALPENDEHEGEWSQSVLLAAGESSW
ncbi:hypothetical protein F5I97DRAFT_1803723 [Phlebopus sp. FC_14]|nr:hypothetical protein F5I97DRAFT_1803723 [Phlebopus sp. FC_14]